MSGGSTIGAADGAGGAGGGFFGSGGSSGGALGATPMSKSMPQMNSGQGMQSPYGMQPMQMFNAFRSMLGSPYGQQQGMQQPSFGWQPSYMRQRQYLPQPIGTFDYGKQYRDQQASDAAAEEARQNARQSTDTGGPIYYD